MTGQRRSSRRLGYSAFPFVSDVGPRFGWVSTPGDRKPPTRIACKSILYVNNCRSRVESGRTDARLLLRSVAVLGTGQSDRTLVGSGRDLANCTMCLGARGERFRT